LFGNGAFPRIRPRSPQVFDELLFDAPNFGDPVLVGHDDGDPPVERAAGAGPGIFP